jgi:alpha-glucosidase
MTGQLKVNVEGEFKDTNALANVTILGAPAVGQVKLNGETIDASKVSYNSTSSVLKLSGLNDLTSGGAWQGSWTLSWE